MPETADSAFTRAGSWLIPGLPSPEPGHIRPPWQGRSAEARPCSSWARDRVPSGWRAPPTYPARRLARVPYGHPRLPRYGPLGGSEWPGALMQRQCLEARPGQLQFRVSRASLSRTMPRDYSGGDTNTATFCRLTEPSPRATRQNNSAGPCPCKEGRHYWSTGGIIPNRRTCVHAVRHFWSKIPNPHPVQHRPLVEATGPKHVGRHRRDPRHGTP